MTKPKRSDLGEGEVNQDIAAINERISQMARDSYQSTRAHDEAIADVKTQIAALMEMCQEHIFHKQNETAEGSN